MRKIVLLVLVFFFLIVGVSLVFFRKSFLSSKQLTSNTTSENSSNTGSNKDTKRSSCLLFPQEYCNSATKIDGKNQLGGEYQLLAFKLPTGVPLYAMADGDLIKGTGANGVLLTIKDLSSSEAVSYGIQGDIKPTEDAATRKVKKGDVIGYTQNTGVKLPIPGEYNIVANAIQVIGNRIVYRIDILQSLFSKN